MNDRIMMRVIFIDDLTDQLFEAIFKSNQTSDTAVLIGHYSKVEFLRLHFAHQSIHGFILWNHHSDTHMSSYYSTSQTSSLLLHEILDKGDSHNIIILGQNWQARYSMFNGHINCLRQGK